MAKDDTQRAAYEFLLERLQSQEPFTITEFVEATGWEKPRTIGTYLRKQYKGLIENVEGGPFKITDTDRYRVTESFRKLVTWRKFKQHVTQVRRVVTNYEPSSSQVLIYDFLMPLTNEAFLRTTLDSLFYKDAILARLKTIPSEAIQEFFPRTPGMGNDEYYDSILAFIQLHFIGYSIAQVDGRFRSGKLLTQDEVAKLHKKGDRYLIDETTAVTRFIFPYQNDDELKKVRYLFRGLFVRSIIQLVNGEEQIWMLESGPQSRVHIWRTLGEEEEDDQDDEEAMSCRDWLRQNGYEDVANLIAEAMVKMAARGSKQRRNWWDVLSGGHDGKPYSREGIEFPVLRVAQVRQRKPITRNAISRNKQETPPLARTSGRWGSKGSSG